MSDIVADQVQGALRYVQSTQAARKILSLSERALLIHESALTSGAPKQSWTDDKSLVEIMAGCRLRPAEALPDWGRR